MNFLIRNVESRDLGGLYRLASQFALLNLPPEKRTLSEKIERSLASFAGELPLDKSEYLFVVEDIESRSIAGSSLILGKHGTPQAPHFYFNIRKQDHFSEDLGLGFIHKVLQLGIDTDGPTEIGGLLVDRSYRGRPEKLGRQISLARFHYMALRPERFEETILCEFAPPLTDDGRSEFWEALGRRFTGLPYQEADRLSHEHKEFIETLFPKGEIYLCLLDARARLVVGRVNEETKPAQHMLTRIGFKYRHQVDPFDGGPHYSAQRNEISLIRDSKAVTIEYAETASFNKIGFIGCDVKGEYRSVMTPYSENSEGIRVPKSVQRVLQVESSQDMLLSPLSS